jgi:hypothetical protein
MFEPDDLLLALTDADVEFVVIGGVAVGVHGFVRATRDLDVVPDPAPENLVRLEGVTVRRPPDLLIATIAIRTDTPLLHLDADFDTIARHAPLRTIDLSKEPEPPPSSP